MEDYDDLTKDLLHYLQHANDLAAHTLKAKSYGGSVYATEIEKVPDEFGPVTEKHSTTASVNVLAK